MLIDENTVVTCSFDKTVKIIDLISNTVIKSLEDHTDEVWCVTKLADGQIATGSANGQIIIYK